MSLFDGVALMSTQYAFDGNGPFDAKTLVKTFAELTDETTWQNSNGDNLAYNGMTVAVWRERNEDAYKNGIYFLHDGTTKRIPDVTQEANWHKLADLGSLTSLTETLATRLTALENVELFKKIASESELPKDFSSDNFNPNITYYTYNAETSKFNTFIFDKSISSYICTTPSVSSISIARVEINSNDELVVYYTDGTSVVLGNVVGRDGLTTAIKIGESLYTHNNGIIELPNFVTIDYVDEKLKNYVTKDILEGYATKDYVEDTFTESLKAVVLNGGDADPNDD